MLISATGNRLKRGFESSRRSAQQGFTLIELLVVLTVIGLASAMVVLTMPDPRGDVRAEAERFAARANAARDTAIIEAHDMALAVHPKGYVFERWQGGQWHAVDDKSWGEGIIARSTTPARTVFDTVGGSEVLTITLSSGEDRASIRIGADGSIHVGA